MIKETIEDIINLAESGEIDWCVTFEDRNDNWVQFTWDSINLKYPFSMKPKNLLNNKQIQLSSNMKIVSYKDDLFLTIANDYVDIDDLTFFIKDYFKKIFDSEENDLTVTKEKL